MYVPFKIIIVLFLILISVAFITLLERKILSFMGIRLGPLKVSFLGILQPLLDAVKISQKQTNVLSNFTFFYYYFSSFVMIVSSLMLWLMISFDPKFIDIKLTVLFFFFFLAMHTVNSLFAGWSSFSKYSMLASLRVISQLISYEAVIFICLFFFLFFYNSFSFYMVFFNISFFLIFPILFFFWVLSCLAELSRTPCDFSESESELVSGFNIDYGSKFFSIIFMAEYSNILFFSLLTSFLFFYLSDFFMFIFFLLFYFFIIWIRAVLPRFRYDFFMMICWKFILPFCTFYFFFFIIFISTF